MADDVLRVLVRLLADMGREVAETLGDAEGREALMAHAGLPAPASPPPSSPDAKNLLEALHAKAHAGTGSDEANTLELLAELSEAMIVLSSLVQEAAALDPGNPDDWWNLTATFLDWAALRRLKAHNTPSVALLQALHLISDDRLLIADLIRARAHWGSFLLGHPASDEAKADNWSIIIGAAFAAGGKLTDFEDDKAAKWSPDMLFGWDPEASPEHPRATQVLQRMGTVVLTHRDGELEEHVGLSLVVVPPSDGGWGMFFALDLGATLTFPIGEHLELVLEADAPDAIEVFTGSEILPGFFQPSGTATSARIALRRKAETAEHWVIGADDKAHLEIGTFLLAIELGDPTRFRLAIGDGGLVLPRDSVGLLGALLPSDGATLSFDVDLVVDARGNVAFAGGAGMTVTTPVNKSIAGLTVRSVTVALAIEGAEHTATAALSAVAAFGVKFGDAFAVTVDQIGAKLAWALPPSPSEPGAPVVPGNVGPYGNVGVDFVAPRGIGITLKIGSMHGGGFLFFDPAHGTYGGALEVALTLCDSDTEIQLKAAGLLRETEAGWAFVVIVSAQFHPPIEVFGTGMLLTGVGGMAGVNVGVSIDALRAGLHDGAVGRLLFPDDPVANAPAIVETMTAVFPPRDGGRVAGPLLQLGWGRPKQFVTVSAAIVLTWPSPKLLVILGRLRVLAPDPLLPTVDINADFVGVISFEEPSVAFDAALVDSRIAGYNLTGDLALRLGQPGFILAIGGFHPRFTPPASVPALRRLALDVSADPVTKIRAEAYLAVTSNTFQIGLHARLDIDAGPASIHGWLDFDALVAWEPHWYVSIRVEIGLELRVGGHTVAGVEVDLLFEGPGPWHAKGNASLHFFFFTVHAGFDKTWGEVDPGARPPDLDATSVVVQALSDDGAWREIAPRGGAVVTFRVVERQAVGVHPYGQLSVRQQAVPLGIPVTRIGRSHVVGGSATVVVTPMAGTPASVPTTGHFAAAQFQDLSDDEKLSRPSFEPFQDGLAFGAAQLVISADQVATASYETVFVPDGGRHVGPLDARLLVHALEVGAIARAGGHQARLYDGPDQRVRMTAAAYRIVVADTLTAAPDLAQTFTSAAAAHAAAATAGRRVVVVEAHEMAGS
jgi:hypothetical protein